MSAQEIASPQARRSGARRSAAPPRCVRCRGIAGSGGNGAVGGPQDDVGGGNGEGGKGASTSASNGEARPESLYVA